MQERTWRDVDLKRRQIIVSSKKQDGDGAGLSEKDIGTGNRIQRRTRPWRISTDVPRALLDTLVAGVGYLLLVVPHPT